MWAGEVELVDAWIKMQTPKNVKLMIKQINTNGNTGEILY